MSNGPVYMSPVAKVIPFGPAGSLVSNNVEDAILEAQKTLTSYFLSSSSTVSTTSATYGTIADMTITPGVGKWIGIFTCNFRSTGVNTLGNIALFVDGVQAAYSTRQQYDNAAILGLVTLSTNEGASSGALVFELTCTATTQLTIRFNETQGGTTFIDGRSFVLFQSGL